MDSISTRNILLLLIRYGIFLQLLQSVLPASFSSEEELSDLEILYPKDQFCHVTLHTLHNEVRLNATFPWTEVPEEYDFYQNTYFYVKTKTTVQVSNKNCKHFSNLTSIILMFPHSLEIDMSKVKLVKVNNEQNLKVFDDPFNYTTDPDTILPGDTHLFFTNDTLKDGDVLDIYTSSKINLERIPMQRELVLNPEQLSGPPIILSVAGFPDMPLYFPDLFPRFSKDSTERPTFTLKATHCKNDNTSIVSNMHVEKTTQHPEMKNCFIDHFHITPPLPAKQIRVFVLSGFQNYTVEDISTFSYQPRNITIWITPELQVKAGKNVSQILANDTIKPLNYFEKVLKFEYPLDKLDVIILPTDIGLHVGYSGLGLIADWEPYIHDLELLKEDIVKGSIKTFNLLIFSQWIGGVVSAAPTIPKYGLNCAFDFEALLNDYIFQTFKYIEVNTPFLGYFGPDECGSKEMPIFLMQEAIFSKEVMHSAITDIFLPTMIWKTAQVANFSESIQQSIIQHNMTHLLPYGGNVTVEIIIDNWVSSGFQIPKILVNKSDNLSEYLYLSHLKPEESCEPNPGFLWVPMKILHNSGQDLVWLSPDNHGNNTLNYTIPSYNKTLSEIIINPNGSACYFVDYSSNLVADIASHLTQNVSMVKANGRRYLIYNQFRLAESMKSTEYVTNALNLLAYLPKETHTPTLQLAVRSLYSLFNSMKNWGDPDNLENLFENDNLINQTRISISLILDNVLENYNRTNADIDINVFEWPIIRSVLRHSDQFEILFMARLGTKLVKMWMETPNESPFTDKLQYDQYQFVCAAIKGYGNSDVELKAIFDFITDKFLTFEDAYDVKQMGKSLACSKNEEPLAVLLNIIDVHNVSKSIKSLYLEEFPKAILAMKPATMTKTIYEFWKDQLLKGNLEVDRFVNLLLLMDHNVYKFPGFRDEVYQFFRDNQQSHYGLFFDSYLQFKIGKLKMKLFRPLPPTVLPPLSTLS